MKRSIILLAVVCGLLIAFAAVLGQRSPSAVPRRAPSPFVCHHKTPAQAGECIRQEFDSEGITPAAPLATLLFGAGHATCVDISRWQGSPNWALVRRAGVECVIVQTNDWSAHNPFFAAQIDGAHAAGLKVGVYLFVEGGSPSYQVAVARSVARSVRASYLTLGAFADAEVPGAYAVTCSVVRGLHAGFRIVGVYGSPGTYRGGRCEGFVWPAEWGSGRAYPLPGYPTSAVKFRQNCGTCRIAGFSGEVDRDEDLGLMALAELPPKPKPAHGVLLRERESLRRILRQYGCRRRVKQHQHLGPRCRKWFASGQRVNRELA